MFKGRIVSIYISPAASRPMQRVEQVQAVAGKGLEGDRYYQATGTYSKDPDPSREVTLIEVEAIEALQKEDDLTIRPGDARRNLVTHGVPLNHLVGKEFKVGETVLRGIRLCEPCKHLASLTRAEVLPGLVHRGGLRAEILCSGTIRPGDEVVES